MHSLDTIVSRAKRKWFVYPGSDIYGGLANAWDYGPYGSQLRKNILDAWWKFFVQEQANIMWIEWAILMHPQVREASGHVWWFNDPLVDDKLTWERFRADKLIEDRIEIMRWDKDDNAITKYFSETYQTSNLTPDSRTLEQQYDVLVWEEILNPNSKKKADWTDVRHFNLMLSTKLWVIEDESSKVWMRPETAQAMFVNFKNVIDTTRARLPFGLAQVGKAFRNEITPWNFLFRTKEFEQMEIQMFLSSEDNDTWFTKFQEMSRTFWKDRIWLSEENLRNRDHDSDELAHYASQARDFEYKFPRWRWELQWIHDRWDFDLQAHQKHSGKNLMYTDPYTWERFIPNVIELSMWLSRTVVTVMLDAYAEEELTNSKWQPEIRTVARFPFAIAPVKAAIFPLIKKDEKQVEIAKNIYASLSQHIVVEYDEGGAIGKRYRRQDEIGTPYCITVDNESIDNGTVTVRERDSMEQESILVEDLLQRILNKKNT